MDISAKISQEDAILLNELKNDLLKRDIRISQKELLDHLIKLGIQRQRDLLFHIQQNREEIPIKSRKDAIEKWLNGPTYNNPDKDWLSKIDTSEYDYELQQRKRKKR